MRNEHLRPKDGIEQAESYDWKALARDVADETPERDEDSDGWVKRVYLGSVLSLAPSGKYYMPFACSNLNACPVCNGKGTVQPRKRASRLTTMRRRSRVRRLVRLALKREGCAPDWRAETSERIAHARTIEARGERERQCDACDGTGSNEAATDAAFWERLEELADEIGAFIDFYDDSVFLAMCAEAPENEESEDSDEQGE